MRETRAPTSSAAFHRGGAGGRGGRPHSPSVRPFRSLLVPLTHQREVPAEEAAKDVGDLLTPVPLIKWGWH